MKQKNFIDIYKRNVIGTFNRGFIVARISPIVWPIIHFILLPLTLTFGAGIKSIIDFNSRKIIPEKVINDTNSQIDGLDEDSIKPLIKEITGYAAKSESSRKLREILSNQPAKTTLDLKTRKKLLKKYLLAAHNNGKKTQQIICNHFFQPINAFPTSDEAASIAVKVAATQAEEYEIDPEFAYGLELSVLLDLMEKEGFNKALRDPLNKVIDQIRTLKAREYEDTEELTLALINTRKRLTGEDMSAEAYEQYAHTVQGQPSLDWKIFGGLMIVMAIILAIAIIIACVALPPAAVGAGAAAVATVGGVGALCAAGGAGLFAYGAQRGLSKAMSELNIAARPEQSTDGSDLSETADENVAIFPC